MARFIDFIFIIMLSFMLSFTWCRYYVSNNLVCLIIAVSIAALLGIVYWIVSGRRRRKRNSKAVNASKKEKLLIYLALHERQTALFCDIFKSKGYDTKRHDSESVLDNGAFLAEKNGKTILIGITFLLRQMTIQDLVPFIKFSKVVSVSEIKLFCASAANEVQSFAKKNGVSIYDLDLTASLLEECGMFPKLDGIKPIRQRFKFLSTAFIRKRSSYYFISAVFLLLTSFIAFFPLYYIIFASFLFLFSTYSRFNTRFNHKALPASAL